MKQKQQKSSIPIPLEVKRGIEDAINSKKEKTGGKRYRLLWPFTIPGQKPIPESAILIECNDGYFLIQSMGHDHYRVGVKYIAEMSVSEVPVSD